MIAWGTHMKLVVNILIRQSHVQVENTNLPQKQLFRISAF